MTRQWQVARSAPGQLCLCPLLAPSPPAALQPRGCLMKLPCPTPLWVGDPTNSKPLWWVSHRQGAGRSLPSTRGPAFGSTAPRGVPKPGPSFLTAPHRCRFVGRPGDYVYIFRSFRMEEVSEVAPVSWGPFHSLPDLVQQQTWEKLQGTLPTEQQRRPAPSSGGGLFCPRFCSDSYTDFFFFFFCKTFNVFFSLVKMNSWGKSRTQLHFLALTLKCPSLSFQTQRW